MHIWWWSSDRYTALIYKLEQTIHFIQEQKDSLGGYRGSSWLQTSGVKPVPLHSLKYLQLVGLSPYQLGQGGQYTGQFFENYLLLLVVLGLRCCTQAFSGCGEHGLLVVVASPGAEHRLQVPGSQQWWCAGCSCPQHADPPPDQGSHPCPLHWQVDSHPRHHQGNLMWVFQYCTLHTVSNSFSSIYSNFS